MKTFILLFFISCMSLPMFAQGGNYELVWSDEFNVAGPIEATKWHHQTLLPNGNSWYNGEIQHYTNRIENSFVSDGTLKIVAKKEIFTDQGSTKTHTSARLNSKFAFTYGYVEIRAKLPIGIGTWPAMWTLGQNITEPGGYWYETNGEVSWPACGEIDIMEHWGTNQNYVQSAMHTPSSFGDTVNKGGQTIATASSAFHIYGLEWTPDRMVFSVDGTTHYIYEPSVQNANTWPFDAPQYLLLNVAILPEILDSFTESALEIDYVRVFQDPTLSITEEAITTRIQLSPNPVRDTLSLQVAPTIIGAKATVYSMTGQKVYTATIESGNTLVDVSGYTKGVYFVTIETGQTSVTRRVIKR
ncbi:family 16 glycosylhydrolase [Dokdonia pacifica]|uniref:Por secretion system C-terminal sorting domain-containing protein n=2 Tax=Dokdonia pacifica TaxID=1627892 RepID=A0A238ZAR5_9FLAO|nr:family 16 glycosylhydrolase [Dokdonia pacifica]SNR80078.1 Por secretion system C-terminal sorting domain-containing protein [Dokdonia pacifica]